MPSENKTILFELLTKSFEGNGVTRLKDWQHNYKKLILKEFKKLNNTNSLNDFCVYFLKLINKQLEIIVDSNEYRQYLPRVVIPNKMSMVQREEGRGRDNGNCLDMYNFEENLPLSQLETIPPSLREMVVNSSVNICGGVNTSLKNSQEMKNNEYLMKLSIIYSFIMNDNLTTSFLNEIGVLLDFVNNTNFFITIKKSTEMPLLFATTYFTTLTGYNDGAIDTTDDKSYEIIKEILGHGSGLRLFGMNVLALNVHMLATLDDKTLAITIKAIGNYRNEYKSSNFDNAYKYLLSSLKHKRHFQKYGKELITNFDRQLSLFKTNSETVLNNIFQDNNVKPSHQSFYEILNTWRKNQSIIYDTQNDNSQIISNQIIPQIRKIFRIGTYSNPEGNDDLIMLAKFVVKCLLVSLSKARQQMILIPFDYIDMRKSPNVMEHFLNNYRTLNTRGKLHDSYQFPNEQRFYYILITECNSLNFLEYMKVFIYAALLRFSNNIQTHDLMAHLYKPASYKFSYQPLFISTDRKTFEVINVLGKFYGLTTFSLLMQKRTRKASDLMDDTISNVEDNRLSIYSVLHSAIINGKVLITLPWVVQYFSVLKYDIKEKNDIEHNLDNYKAMQLLFTLYTAIREIDASSRIVSSIFHLLRLPLDWLFELCPKLLQDFYILLRKSTKKSNKIEKYLFSTIGILNSHRNINITVEDRICQLLEEHLICSCPFLEFYRLNAFLSTCFNNDGSNIICSKKLSLYEKYMISYEILKPRQTQRYYSDVEAMNLSFILRFLDYCLKYVRPLLAIEQQRHCPSNTEFLNCRKMLKSFLCTKLKPNSIHWANSMLTVRLIQEISCLLLTLCNGIVLIKYQVYLPLKIVRDVQSVRPIEEQLLQITFVSLDILEEVKSIQKLKEIVERIKVIEDKHNVNIDAINNWLQRSLLNLSSAFPVTNLIKFLEEFLLELKTDSTLRQSKHNLTMGKAVIRLLQLLIANKPQIIKDAANKIFSLSCRILDHDYIKYALFRYSNNDCKSFSDYIDAKNQRKIKQYCSSILCNDLITIDFIKSCNNNKASFDLFGELLITTTKQFHLIKIDDVNDSFLSMFSYEWELSTYNLISQLLRRMVVANKDKNTTINNDEEIPQPLLDVDDNDCDNYTLNIEKSILFMDLLADLSNDLDK